MNPEINNETPHKVIRAYFAEGYRPEFCHENREEWSHVPPDKDTGNYGWHHDYSYRVKSKPWIASFARGKISPKLSVALVPANISFEEIRKYHRNGGEVERVVLSTGEKHRVKDWPDAELISGTAYQAVGLETRLFHNPAKPGVPFEGLLRPASAPPVDKVTSKGPVQLQLDL